MTQKSDLPDAYLGVYSSSKAIIKNNQRHLYANMLDLLNRATKSAGSNGKDFIRQEHLDFWYNDILVLAFDEDKNIQDLAIAALESALYYSDALKNQDHPEWQKVKKTILEVHCRKLEELRLTSNSNWYKIWSLLIRILDKDILKGASVINTFLAIVEFGFRSVDFKTRAEAFLCWKVLIEIFAKYDEIFSPKRIKLICIPLRSSQSKTVDTAVNKFRIWWCFICKLSPKLDEYAETILMPFLTFCFGPIDDTTVSGTMAQAKIYPLVKRMAVNCLIEMLGSPVKIGVLSNFELEQPTKVMITPKIMSSCFKPIISACVEATLLLTDQHESCAPVYNRLWLNLRDQISETNNLDVFCECVNQISTLINNNDEMKTNRVLRNAVSHIVELLTANNHFPFTQKLDGVIEVSKLCDLIYKVTEIICHSSLQMPAPTKCACIENVYQLERYKTSLNHWNILKTVSQLIIDNDLCKLEYLTKIDIWKIISPQLVDYIKDRIFEFRIDQNADLLNDWLMWPLDKVGKLNDAKLFDSWKTLAASAARAEGYSNFVEKMSGRLQNLFQNENKLYRFPTIIGYFIDTLDIKFDNNSKPTAALKLINHILSQSPSNIENYNKILEHLTSYVRKLEENQIIDAHLQFLTIYNTLVRNKNSNSYDKNSAESFKRTYQDKLKTNKAKEKKLFKDVKEIEKSNSDVFVIIPSLWTYNPDKLTEHQKEKREEIREDIPALYNDMTQSQDTSLKPWTPRKVVIAKGIASEEILLSHDENQDIVEYLGQNSRNNINHIDKNVQDDPSNNQTDRKSPRKSNSKSPVKKDHPVINKSRKSPLKIEPNMSETNTADENVQKGHTNPFKSSKSPTKANKVNVNSPKSPENLEKPKGISVDQDSERKKPKKSIVITESDEQLLEKVNVQVQDAAKKLKLVRELKAMNIDTVEGRQIVEEKLRSRSRQDDGNKGDETVKKNKRKTSSPKQMLGKKQKGSEARKNAKKTTTSPDSDEGSLKSSQKPNKENTNSRRSPKRKSLDEDSIDEVVESSQVSESVISKKVASRRSINSVNKTVSNKKLNFEEIKNGEKLEPIKVESKIEITTIYQNSESKISPLKLLKSDNKLQHENDKLAQENSPSPNNEESLKLSEMETQLNTEAADFNLSIINVVTTDVKCKTSPKPDVSIANSPLSTSRTTSPRDIQNILPQSVKSPICDTNIEPNAEMVNKSPLRPEPSEKHENDVQNDAPLNTNNNIISSPERMDTSERNAELLNNTVNISPISTKSTDFNDKSTVMDELSQNVLMTITPGKCIVKTILVSEIDKKIQTPVLRPKLTKHLTGRGAQLINMIRNKNKLQSPVTITKIQEANCPESGPSVEQHVVKENLTTQTQTRELLTFTKKVPSPRASPSVSILKRKMLAESFDDVETPLNKRKRVSFHDPPVSLTKEYEKLSEEKALKSGLKRCLMPDKTSTPQDQNRLTHSLKRKSRMDSMNEIAKFHDSGDFHLHFGENEIENEFDGDTNEMGCLRWNNNSASENEDEDSISSPPELCFNSEQSLLAFIFRKYDLQDIIEKYHESGKTLNTSGTRLIKTISEIMDNNDKMKNNVLDILSEKHPKEFLEHAIQENMCSVVCEKLNPCSVIDFIFEKPVEDSVVETNLTEKAQKFLQDRKWTQQSYSFILKLLKQHKMSSEEIFNCTKEMYERHKQNEESSNNII